MSIHFRRQTDKLKKMLLTLGGMVEHALRHSIQALDQRDQTLGQQVIDQDIQINRTQLEIEEECLATLALHQPVAFDLRYLIAILKMAADLERIGDLTANIAEQAIFLSGEPKVSQLPFDLPGMADCAQNMLKNALDALVNVDVSLARQVCKDDEQVDDLYRKMFLAIQDGIRQNPDQLAQMIHLMNIARQLERLADHVVNIALDVLYLADGQLVHEKHGQTKDN